MDIKDYVKKYNLSFDKVKSEFDTDFTSLYKSEKEWLENLEDKVHLLKNEKVQAQVSEVINKLKITPIQLIRTNEKIWKEEYKDRELSDREVITAMVKNPKLIERPIVETENNAVIGRPSSDIKKLL